MIGLVLITHGALGDALRDIVEHVAGPQVALETIAVAPEADVTVLRPILVRKVAHVDDGTGVVVLTDIFGSTPSNLALSVRSPGHIEVVAGINVPMLVKLAKIRATRTLGECIDYATMAGRKYIAAATDLPESCLQGGECCKEIATAVAAAGAPVAPMFASMASRQPPSPSASVREASASAQGVLAQSHLTSGRSKSPGRTGIHFVKRCHSRREDDNSIR